MKTSTNRVKQMVAISIVLPGFPVHAGGGYKIVYQYANYLASKGHAVSILHMRPDQLRGHKSNPLKDAVRKLQYRVGRHRRPKWFPLDRRISVSNFHRQFAAGIPEADIIVATAMETADLVASVSAERSVRGIYFIQHYEDWLEGADFVNATWRLPLRKIVIAPWLMDKAKELQVPAVQVPNAIDSQLFPSGRPIADRPAQVLALVSDVSWKRTDLIAEVMTILEAEAPGVSLRTFGVVPRPAALPTSAVHVQDPTPAQLVALYQDSRVHVCASDAEGWHLPPAEAMSCGAAVVSTSISGVRAYAENFALFSPVGDSAALAANVLRLLRDEALCDSLATAGQQSLRAYTVENAAEAFEQAMLSDEFPSGS